MTDLADSIKPVHWMVVGTSLLAVYASLLNFPVEARFPMVFSFLVLVPGYALVRHLELDDPMHVLVLSLATSLGVSSLLSIVALYAGLWSPNGILIAIA